MVKNCWWKKRDYPKIEIKLRVNRRKMYNIWKWYKIIVVQSRINWIRDKLMALKMWVSRKDNKRLRRNYIKIKIIWSRKKGFPTQIIDLRKRITGLEESLQWSSETIRYFEISRSKGSRIRG